MATTPTAGPFDAVVLAGGAGRRLGGADKASVVVAGLPLVDHVLQAVRSARCVVLVARPELARAGILMTLEDPPDGGPVAGLAAGLAVLDREAPADDGLVVVLACDVPAAGRALPTLLAAVAPGVDGARLVDAAGRPQHLVAVYRRAALRQALAGLDECAARRCAPCSPGCRSWTSPTRTGPGRTRTRGRTWRVWSSPSRHEHPTARGTPAPDLRGMPRATIHPDSATRT